MGVYRRVYPRHTSKEVIFKLLKYFKICKLFLSLFQVIYQTRGRVSFIRIIQTLRSGLKKRGAAEFF